MNRSLYKKIALNLFLYFPIMGIFIFLPAGTLDYWEAWVFIAVFFACNLALTGYLVLKDPKLLERRMKVGPAAEKTMTQKIIVALTFVFFAGTALVPALDRRFGWSDVPGAVAVLGDLLIVAAYFGFYRVVRENPYAAAAIRVEEGQKVISTGPYAIVRHPMYSAALILSLGIVLALGSWAGLLILVPVIAVVVWRLLDEETFLHKELSGYPEYMRKVRRRLIPGIF